jgi:hypothetical protein
MGVGVDHQELDATFKKKVEFPAYVSDIRQVAK